MVLKKLGFKSGSWLLNVEPKSKNDSKDSKINVPKSAKSLSVLEEDFVRGNVDSTQDQFSVKSPGSAPSVTQQSTEDSFRYSRRQSTLPTAKALFKMFATGTKKEGKQGDSDELRRATMSVSTSQLGTSANSQSHSSLVAPSFTTQYYSPKSDKDITTNTTDFIGETVSSISEINEALPSPHSQASVKPFKTAESAPYTISVLDPHLQPRAASGIEMDEGSASSPRPNSIVLERQMCMGHTKAASTILPKPPLSNFSHNRTASVGPPLRNKRSVNGVKNSSVKSTNSKGPTRQSSTNSLLSQSKPISCSSISEKKQKSTTDLRDELDRISSQLSKAEEERDTQKTKVSQLQAEVTRGEKALESERASARQELEALLELQHQYQATQRILHESEAIRKTLEAKVKELQNQLQTTRDELTGLSRQSQSQEELLSERAQLRNWLNEEKVRHNEVRGEFTEAKAKLRTNASRINHLEALIQDQNERIKNYEIREAAANESSMKEVIYYQEQLAEAIRSRDDIRDENERNKDQIRILRNTMEQLLKAGVAPEVNHIPSPGSSPAHHDHYNSFSSRQQEFRSIKDSGLSVSSHTQSNPSVCSEEMDSPNPEMLGQGLARHGLGSDRRRTFGLESQVTSSAPLSPVYLSREISLISPQKPTNEVLPPTPNPPQPADENTAEFWDARLKMLLKEKERTELEYGRIPTKVNKAMRRRKEELENHLDQLDSEISGARSRIRTLVI